MSKKYLAVPAPRKKQRANVGRTGEISSDRNHSASNKSTPCAAPAACNDLDFECRSQASSSSAWRQAPRSHPCSYIETPDPFGDASSVRQECAFPLTKSFPRSYIQTPDPSGEPLSAGWGREFPSAKSPPWSYIQTPDPFGDALSVRQECTFPLSKSHPRSYIPTPDPSGEPLSVGWGREFPSAKSPPWSYIQTPDPFGDALSVRQECTFPLSKSPPRYIQTPDPFGKPLSTRSDSGSPSKFPPCFIPTPDPCGEPLTARSDCEFPSSKFPPRYIPTHDPCGEPLSARSGCKSPSITFPPCYIPTPDPFGEPLTARSECEFPLSDSSPYRCIPTPDIFGDALSAQRGCDFPLPMAPAVVEASVASSEPPSPLSKPTGKKKSRPRVKRMQFDRCKYREVLTIPLSGFTFQQAKGRLLGVDGANIKGIASKAPSASVTVVDDGHEDFLQVLVCARYFEAFKHARQKTIELLQILFYNTDIAAMPLGQQYLASMASLHLDSMLGKDYSSSSSRSSTTSIRCVPPFSWSMAASTGMCDPSYFGPEDGIAVGYDGDGMSSGYTSSVYTGYVDSEYATGGDYCSDHVDGYAPAAGVYEHYAGYGEATTHVLAQLQWEFLPCAAANNIQYDDPPSPSLECTSTSIAHSSSQSQWLPPSLYGTLQDGGGGVSIDMLMGHNTRVSSSSTKNTALQGIPEGENATADSDSCVEQEVQLDESSTGVQTVERALADGGAGIGGNSEVLDIAVTLASIMSPKLETLDDVISTGTRDSGTRGIGCASDELTDN
eukprot:GEMP01025257.1.p1 GENE.GEMP01025257.1~~GEMP01025257.1.p1  ORF type:complete len:779 (+),score=143.14 GEMP01025257.1:12-2348(+)